jgi:hypothetical protein
MGHNIDFQWLLDLPEKVKCPKCHNLVRSSFDDYDIDCGTPQAIDNSGFLVLDVQCNICEESFEVKFKTEIK